MQNKLGMNLLLWGTEIDIGKEQEGVDFAAAIGSKLLTGPFHYLSLQKR